MIVIIDNDDSFSYILAQYLGELGHEVTVCRNGKSLIPQIETLHPRYLFISSGSQLFRKSGMIHDVITHFAGKVPILGIGLGHQLIAEAFGGKVIRAKQVMYGKTTSLIHDMETTFSNITSSLSVACYHSLVVENETLPDCFSISAWTLEKEIMAIRHRHLPVEGVQFQIESMMTEKGKQLLENFINAY